MGKRGGLSGFGLHIKATAEGSPGIVQPDTVFLQVQSDEPWREMALSREVAAS